MHFLLLFGSVFVEFDSHNYAIYAAFFVLKTSEKLKSVGNKFNDFPENEVTKFRAQISFPNFMQNLLI